jgi:hypothetical protein
LADVSQRAATLRAPQNFLHQKWTVALNRDVDIVFERERDNVLHRQIEIAGAYQRFQSRRVGKNGWRNNSALQTKWPQERAHDRDRLWIFDGDLRRLSETSHRETTHRKTSHRKTNAGGEFLEISHLL